MRARETIRNPAFWDRPENMGQYRDDRQNVFLDGNSNLVIRATREGAAYFGGRIEGTWRGGIGHTWEARVKLQCLTAGCWGAWWIMTADPAQGGEIDVLEWFGNGGWGPGSTVHTRLDGTTRVTHPIQVDTEWHTWRCQWDAAGVRFWKDFVPGAPPYFDVAAGSVAAWPFNEPGYQMFPILNLAVSGSGGGIPARVSIRRTCSSTGCVSGEPVAAGATYSAAARRSRRMNFWILPEAVIGNASTNSHSFGVFWGARWSWQ